VFNTRGRVFDTRGRVDLATKEAIAAEKVVQKIAADGDV
jgi:hypothetical protein